MKTKLIHLTFEALVCAAVIGLCSGCSAMRPID